MTFLARATINKAQLILAIFILQLPVLAQTQTAYVTDNLRLGLHQASDTSDSAFRNLESGQELRVHPHGSRRDECSLRIVLGPRFSKLCLQP